MFVYVVEWRLTNLADDEQIKLFINEDKARKLYEEWKQEGLKQFNEALEDGLTNKEEWVDSGSNVTFDDGTYYNAISIYKQEVEE